MSIYIDTNVIISFVDEADPNHGKALKLVNKLSRDRVASMLTLVELTSVYSRAGLENPLVLALYSIEVVNARIADVDFNNVLKNAFTYAQKLKLRTLNLLHIVVASITECKKFATFDNEIIKKSKDITSNLEIEVVTET
ncbi:MAG: PIN domain-containing protein [Desulfurococcaceae archaeon]|jgi:predicted nucleic acid-binding protein|nr:PIN domain-containing protein [Desulfurococcaceae archaeon]